MNKHIGQWNPFLATEEDVHDPYSPIATDEPTPCCHSMFISKGAEGYPFKDFKHACAKCGKIYLEKEQLLPMYADLKHMRIRMFMG
jgi:hypothetical protein